jgi:hypothetical protein
MVLGLPIPTTNGANGQNVEDVLLQLTHRSSSEEERRRKEKRKRRSGKDRSVIINQAGKVDVTTTAKMTRGTSIGTTDGAVLPVHHSGTDEEQERGTDSPAFSGRT